MNKILLQLADLSWVKVFLGALVMTAVYYFGMRDDGTSLVQGLEQAKQQLESAQKQLAITKKAMDNAERFEADLKSEKSDFAHITDFMPLKLNTADLTTLMSEKSARVGVHLQNTSPKGSGSSAGTDVSFFDTVRVAFKIEGTFPQIANFLSQISRDPRLLTFEDTVLSKSQGSEGESPLLTFEGDLVGYRYHPPKDVVAPTTGAPAGTAPAGSAPAAPPAGGANGV